MKYFCKPYHTAISEASVNKKSTKKNKAKLASDSMAPLPSSWPTYKYRETQISLFFCTPKSNTSRVDSLCYRVKFLKTRAPVVPFIADSTASHVRETQKFLHPSTQRDIVDEKSLPYEPWHRKTDLILVWNDTYHIIYFYHPCKIFDQVLPTHPAATTIESIANINKILRCHWISFGASPYITCMRSL